MTPKFVDAFMYVAMHMPSGLIRSKYGICCASAVGQT